MKTNNKKALKYGALSALCFIFIYWSLVGILSIFYTKIDYVFYLAFSFGWAIGKGVIDYSNKLKELNQVGNKDETIDVKKSKYFKEMRRMKLDKINKIFNRN